MKPPDDEELILHFYGEAAAPAGIDEALARDPVLRRRYEALSRVLAALPDDPPPERGADYGSQVWARLAPRLERQPRWARFSRRPGGRRQRGARRAVAWGPRWALAGAALVLLAVGFLLGRGLPGSGEAPQLALSAAGRQRILERSVAAHLADSERLLVELANARVEGPVDLAGERQWAEALLAANRLYRLAAEKAGQRRIAALLGELEPLFLDLAHAPEEGTAEDLALLQERLSEQGTLFKVRVAGGRLAGGRSTAHPASMTTGEL
jgi:hypothetical protein